MKFGLHNTGDEVVLALAFDWAWLLLPLYFPFLYLICTLHLSIPDVIDLFTQFHKLQHVPDA